MPAEVLVRSLADRYAHVVETRNHRLLADEPEAAGGGNRGPGPYELLLGALGT
jgi:putative redox protein